MSSAAVKITMNSSYVLIKTTPFRKTRKAGGAARSPVLKVLKNFGKFVLQNIIFG